jgi:NSS family neurotransmitter:Na+ symporter
VIAALIGLPVMLAELTIGRGARGSPIAALRHYGGPAWAPLGVLFVVAGFVILAYYSVIAGWTLRYAAVALVGDLPADSAAYFGAVATGPGAIAGHVLFMGVTIFIVSGGIKFGIERTALLLMPALFVLVCGLAIYAATLDGAGAGYAFYLQTSFADVLSLSVLQDAASQAFFSLSLGMGAILTYASYLPDDAHLPNESLVIAGADFGVAFISGLAVFPLLFALGLQGEASGSSIGTLFVTLPKAFSGMGAAGSVVGVVFFIALAVAALTSAISLLEVVVATAIDSFGWPRRRAALLLGGAIALLGIPPALSLWVLGFMDQLAGNVLLLAGGLGLALFTGFVMKEPLREVSRGAGGVRWFALWRLLLRVPVPLVLAWVLWTSTVALLEML